MKTQLLQDIEDSGGFAPGPGPVPAAAAAARPPAPERDIRPDPPPAPGQDMRRHPPPDSAFDAPDPSSGGEPDWLAELMREDAAHAAARRPSARWMRRLPAWTAVAAVLALLAAGGSWLYEERRVDGALVVVAAKTPPPVVAAPVPIPVPAPMPGPGPGPAPALGPAPASVAPAIEAAPAQPPAATPAIEAAAAAPVTLQKGPATPLATTADGGAKAPLPEPAAHTKAPAERGMSARQRREETLMQCRALGYDERQCIRRGCAMTRFGLACRG